MSSKTMSALEKFMPTRQGEKNGNLTILNNMIAEVKEAENDRDAQKLQKVVGQHIKEIMSMIERQQAKLDKAKGLANKAKDIVKEDTTWNSVKQKATFGLAGIDIDEERAKATVEGLVATNEAMAEMNQVIQGIVALTCCSAAYSKIMIETIGGLLVNGFEKTDGTIIQLSDSSKDILQNIIFTAEQQTLIDREQDNKIENISSRLDEKDEVDSSQDLKIQQNVKSITTNKDLISQNAELIAKNQKDILELQKRNSKSLAILAWVAIVLSLISFGVSLAGKF